MNLPTREQALKIVTTHDLTPLSLEGAAYLQADHAELWQLFTEMVAAGKIDAGNLTGVTLLLGLMLRSERSRH
jgi:hypothetical protein